MARIDALSVLSDRQVVDKITYSDRAIDLTAEIDFGAAPMQHFFKIVVEGAFTAGLTIDIVVANEEDFSDATVIASSAAFTSDELVAGFITFLPVPPVNQKYRYICLKYRPDSSSDENEEEHDGSLCPTDPVLGEVTIEPNTLSAFYSDIADFNTQYPYANDDKDTN